MVTPKDPSYIVGADAVEEKIFAAEKNISWLRCVLVVFNSLVYLFVMEKTGSIPFLANVIIAIALLYSFFVAIYKPYRKHAIFLAGYSTYGTDALLITLWVWATGGFESPFFLLFYISLVAVSFRFSTKTIMLTAFLYAICYVSLIIALGEAQENIIDLLVRTGYIFFIGFLGVMISGETLKQMQQKRQMQQLAKEAHEAEEMLRQQTHLYENLLNAQSEMGEGVCIIEKEKFVYVNDAFCQIFGYSENEMFNMESSLDLIVPEEREVLAQRHGTLFTEGLSAEGGQTLAYKKDGTTIFITYSFKMMEKERRKQLFSIIRDITDEVRSKEALMQKTLDLARSQELDKKKDEFIGVASHELKTPLTSINGYTQLLEQVLSDQLIDPATARLYVKKTQHQIDRLSGLINDLLDVSRIQSGKLHFNMTKFDIRDLLEEVAEGMQLTVRNCSVELENCFCMEITADRTRIEQVLINLMTNAIKYSQKSANVIVGMEQKKDEVLIYVRDFGMGIPKDDLKKIFNRFYRVNTSETKVSGLGIGLFICAEIVERHKGRIWAESMINKGSTFYFTLPV